MPELPEVETMRRGILAVVGSRIRRVHRAACECRPIEVQPRIDQLQRRVTGKKVTAVDRIGKRVVLRLEDGAALVFEPRMTGLVLVADPPDIEHLRLHVQFAGGPIRDIWFWDRRGLGSVRLLSNAQLAAQLGGTKLGPDALAIDAETLRARLAASKRAIKVALLDQRAVAGIGNLYASEMLHLAGLDPRRRCRGLSRDEWRRLWAALREVLELAIELEGSTLSDGTYRNALNKAGGYQNHHRVYDRAGELCPTCGRGTILRIVQAQRATFFCPACQRRPRGRAS